LKSGIPAEELFLCDIVKLFQDDVASVSLGTC
jgi:hypothetical protein